LIEEREMKPREIADYCDVEPEHVYLIGAQMRRDERDARKETRVPPPPPATPTPSLDPNLQFMQTQMMMQQMQAELARTKRLAEIEAKEQELEIREREMDLKQREAALDEDDEEESPDLAALATDPETAFWPWLLSIVQKSLLSTHDNPGVTASVAGTGEIASSSSPVQPPVITDEEISTIVAQIPPAGLEMAKRSTRAQIETYIETNYPDFPPEARKKLALRLKPDKPEKKPEKIKAT
jgi:hypothetical protein